MERLTFEGNFCDIAQCRELPCKYDGNCTQKEVWERLREYENTGLYPESVEALKLSMMGKAISEITEFDGLPIDRLRELAESDKDGRVVVLPCKVGDTVYRLQYIEQTLGRFTVGAVPIKFAFIWLEEFGKTVFLTREEAEKALAEMKGETEK